MTTLIHDPLRSVEYKGNNNPEDTQGLGLIAKCLKEEHSYVAEIEGELPQGLEGTLFRNGPGLFERNGYRKKHILDGDGMIQRLFLKDGQAHYQNHFVRTEKYLTEEKAGKFLYPTWSTLAPKWYQNLPGFPQHSQAGIVATVRDGVLYALDEVGKPWALDPVLLNEIGPYTIANSGAADTYKAHNKIDGRNGDWIFLGWSERRHSVAQVLIKNKAGDTIVQRDIPLPRRGYVHDFFITENYVIINLQAIAYNPLKMLFGRESIIDSLRWKPEIGNILCVVERKNDGKVSFINAPATFMWHVFNAYEIDGNIIADFIGYDEPDHFIGDSALLSAIMNDQKGGDCKPGTVRRYRINLEKETAMEETLFEGDFEFPMIHYAVTGYKNRYGFSTTGKNGVLYHDSLVKFDFEEQKKTHIKLGNNVLVGEPVYAVASAEDNGKGHLLSLCLDGDTSKSFVAVVDADSMKLACKINLRHATPLSFHGCWEPLIKGTGATPSNSSKK